MRINDENIQKCIVIFSLLIFLFFFLVVLDSTGEKEPEHALENLTVVDERSDHYELLGVSDDFDINSCEIEDWNKITTNSIPYTDQHDIWIQEKDQRHSLFHTTLSPFSAYVYNTHITVTLSSETFYRKNVTCRYFDCRRNEILPRFKSRVFPQSTVHCGRRAGAEYISVAKNENDDTDEKLVPIQKRLTKMRYSKLPTYKHLFTVCLATLYGDEPKFLQIAEFVEHYKLQGATYFHVYVANISNYDRRILDDYVKGNEIEVIDEMDYYRRDDFMWHDIQINDCHHRSKNFAKWTAFVDIDEKMEMLKTFPTIGDYLKNIKNPNVNMLHWQIQWVIKNETSPEKYENDAQIIENMTFRRFRNTSQIRTINMKSIVRPEQFAMMTIHAPKFPYHGYEKRTMVGDFGVVKHYRNMGTHDKGIFKLQDKKFQRILPFYIPDKEPWQLDLLTKNVLDRVKKVYGAPDLTCEQRKDFYRKNARSYSC